MPPTAVDPLAKEPWCGGGVPPPNGPPLRAGHQALAARSGIQLRLVPSPRGVFVGVGVCGSMPVQQVSGVPWGWHRGAKMRFELEWGGS